MADEIVHTGELKVEIEMGDFIKDSLRPFVCGIVQGVRPCRLGRSKIRVYDIELANGSWDVIFEPNAEFIAR
jgi:hypothetical protein